MSSTWPASRACRVPGTQIVPAEVAVVPPTCADFSHSSTSTPSSAHTSAVVMPAAPAPITNASTSTSPSDIGCDGLDIDLRQVAADDQAARVVARDLLGDLLEHIVVGAHAMMRQHERLHAGLGGNLADAVGA